MVRKVRERAGFVDGRRVWIECRVCPGCHDVMPVALGQWIRVDFEDLRYLSTVVCPTCAAHLRNCGELVFSVLGRSLEIYKTVQPGPWRVRGDKAWHCRGVIR